jgi:hypothetical protein
MVIELVAVAVVPFEQLINIAGSSVVIGMVKTVVIPVRHRPSPLLLP